MKLRIRIEHFSESGKCDTYLSKGVENASENDYIEVCDAVELLTQGRADHLAFETHEGVKVYFNMDFLKRCVVAVIKE